MPPKRFLLALLFAPLAVGSAPLAVAETANEAVCLFSRDITHVQILDREHILFFMRNGAVWQNNLWKTCYSLRPDSYLDWGQDDWHRAICSWPIASPPLPVKDSRNPPDTQGRSVVFLRSHLEACRLGDFTRYSPSIAQPAGFSSPGH